MVEVDLNEIGPRPRLQRARIQPQRRGTRPCSHRQKLGGQLEPLEGRLTAHEHVASSVA